ncbi:MAG: hypothetical protein EAZ08_09620 [Cytophagales bacterium]|nr:MAG: hypothetical protein EAZ08_09620 [Cytophagales bacterium]
MKIHLKVNIIHTPKLPLSVAKLEGIDRFIEEKLNIYFANQEQDWTHSLWKIFSEQIDKQEFKKPKKITKSKITEYYCWIPARINTEKSDYLTFYMDCLKNALQTWLKDIFQVQSTDFLSFWESFEKEIPILEKELQLV